MEELFTTVIHRPYVFAFLAAYLVLAWRLWGWRRTILWLVTGYAIAWASEFSSIHNGFPYGEYHYIYANMPGELMIAGVPFFDSLSYPFLIFAGYTTACFLTDGARPRDHETTRPRTILLGAFLTMILDVIIDPVAKLGSQWFLGDIYWYAHEGWYFRIPFTNFAGWFLVALAIIAVNVLIWTYTPKRFFHRTIELSNYRTNWLYPAFYLSIALFNIAVTWWIGAKDLGMASSGIFIVLVAVMLGAANKRSLTK